MTIQRHIIQKSTVDLQFDGGGDAFALQKEVDEWCDQELMPLLDEVLNPYDGLKEHLRIDRLEVDVTINLDDGWRKKLTHTLSRQLRERLDELNTGSSGIEFSKKTVRQSFADLLVFYLEKGYLPWWSGVKDKRELVEQWGLWLNEGDEAGEKLRAALDKYPARLRMIQLLPEELFYALVGWLNPELKKILPGLLNELRQITEDSAIEEKEKVRVAFQAGLLKQAAEGKDISKQLVNQHI